MVLNFLKSGYQKVKSALNKTRSLLGTKLRTLFNGPIDEEMLENLEQALYEADLGVDTSLRLTELVRKLHLQNPSLKAEDYITAIKKEISASLCNKDTALRENNGNGPTVLLIVGVNGSGKTTSIAKIAHHLTANKKSVLICAADTFRAAAVEQLELWAKRTGASIVKGSPNSDPAAVAFDGISAGIARQIDYVIIDTAGRLQSKSHLMQELEKIKRSCHKALPGAPHETLMVLDANTGNNGIDQAKTFHNYTPLNGLILTKLDGTAKGGIVVSASQTLSIPVKFIGIGEGMEDFKAFDTSQFVEALFS